MADARLVATNPEDSSVVPVACNADGRLLLEEQGQGPQGEQGPQGPKGDDGDPFSGNFADDVTFGGSASFAGFADFIRDASNGFAYLAIGPGGTDEKASFVQRRGEINLELYSDFSGDATVSISSDGSGTFAEAVTVGPGNPTNGNNDGTILYGSGGIGISKASGALITFNQTGSGSKGQIYADGSANFAGNKAGFTAEGYLWCTTVRGDTVMLDATSNGMGVWVQYEPSTRSDEIRDRLDAIRGDTGEMPADTP